MAPTTTLTVPVKVTASPALHRLEERRPFVELLLDRIIQREGGFVNRAEDRGGPTNWGITIGTLSEVRGHPATAESVRALTVAEARTIYLKRYITPFTGIEAEDLLDLVVDTAVNNGRGRAALWLQRAAGVVEDGMVGPVTLARVNFEWVNIYYSVVRVRVDAYAALVSQKHSQAIFVVGWMKRVGAFIRRVGP